MQRYTLKHRKASRPQSWMSRHPRGAWVKYTVAERYRQRLEDLARERVRACLEFVGSGNCDKCGCDCGARQEYLDLLHDGCGDVADSLSTNKDSSNTPG